MIITKDVLKAEIDNVQEEYLDALYRIIKVFEYPPTTGPFVGHDDLTCTKQEPHSDWLARDTTISTPYSYTQMSPLLPLL